jgi:hypothetical protein
MTVRIHLNPNLKREVAAMSGTKTVIHEAGEAVADNVRALGIRVEHIPGDIELPVEVDEDGTVVLVHPSGKAVQAKHGALTKAAAQAGLPVQGR